LARIHILLLSLATLRCGLCLWPDGESGGLGRSRVGDEQAVWRVGQSCVCCCQWQSLVWTRATDGFCVVRRLSVCEPRVVDGRYMGSDLRLVFRTCRATLVKAVLPNASRSPALSQSLICLLAVHAIAQSFQHLDCETRRPSPEVAGTVILGALATDKEFSGPHKQRNIKRLLQEIAAWSVHHSGQGCITVAQHWFCAPAWMPLTEGDHTRTSGTWWFYCGNCACHEHGATTLGRKAVPMCG